MAQYFEPDMEPRNLYDMVQILNAEPAKSMEEFAGTYPLWKAAYQMRISRIGARTALNDDVRKTICILILQPCDREDFMRHRHLWRDAEALDGHLLQIIADRT